MSEEDLTQKFGPMSAASCHKAFQAVLTVSVVRNLLSHLQGSVKGLSQTSFNCLCGRYEARGADNIGPAAKRWSRT